MTRGLTFVALLGVAVLLAGCASTSKTDLEKADTPLPLDPTDDIELAEWWTNGYHLLHLGGDGFYRLYAENNRYLEPLERGKWWQQSYATVWLETYDQLPVRPSVSVPAPPIHRPKSRSSRTSGGDAIGVSRA